MSDTVRYDVTDGVATITMNRPAAMNAVTAEMRSALRAAVERATEDPAVRAVVLTGAGRAFCAGQDLREHAMELAAGHGLLDTVRSEYNPLVLAIAELPKPVIAAVNGTAAGAGASLAFACDLRVAAQSATFLMAFARVGLGPDSGASWTLQRLVGQARAAELLMLAEPLRAPRAHEIGLVTTVVPDDQVGEAAHALAARLAAGPTLAYAAIKEALAFAADSDLPTSLEKEAELQARCGDSADHKNATAAFVRKEQPVFTGR